MSDSSPEKKSRWWTKGLAYTLLLIVFLGGFYLLSIGPATAALDWVDENHATHAPKVRKWTQKFYEPWMKIYDSSPEPLRDVVDQYVTSWVALGS